MAHTMIEVVSPGPYATIQDLGRPGYAHLGVPRSGAADVPSLRLANRLVGNDEDAAGIELTFGGAVLRFARGAWIALTGAPCPLDLSTPVTGAFCPLDLSMPVSRRQVGMYAPVWVPAGGELRVGMPADGLRTYLAVRGGIRVEPVLGSRSTDSLAGLGPAPLRAGTRLPFGPPIPDPSESPAGDQAAKGPGVGPMVVDVVPQRAWSHSPVVRVIPGPRDDWFTPEALKVLAAAPYEVTTNSNRIGARLRGGVLERARKDELPSEGMPVGAVQVPPSGQPIVFLADHPPTGGYPVIGVVITADIPVVAQLRPGDHVRFHVTGRPAPAA